MWVVCILVFNVVFELFCLIFWLVFVFFYIILCFVFVFCVFVRVCGVYGLIIVVVVGWVVFICESFEVICYFE